MQIQESIGVKVLKGVEMSLKHTVSVELGVSFEVKVLKEISGSSSQ